MHTKGDWLAVGTMIEHLGEDEADIAVFDPEAFCQGHLGRSYKEMSANAQLCAAAPKLLVALKQLVEIVDDQLDGEFPEALADAQRAIASATYASR